MTFKYYEGSVFECAEYNNVDMIVNTVNCKGFMGAGLALEFKLRYPSMFEDYKKKCTFGLIEVGTLDIYDNELIKIMSFPTKDDWKKPSNISWIKEGLRSFYNNYKNYGVKSVAFPKLGTNNGGLDWQDVKDLMERCFSKLEDIEIFICLDNRAPKGTEGKMLNILNNITHEELKQIRLNSKSIDKLIESRPYKRFFEVSKIKGIGVTSYQRLHDYCYNHETNVYRNNKETEQLSLFE
jgi:O-acetyl-ADP-ribose deacetylase (regulator of RNase III)